MKIALIASEVTPFSKTGGLADVLGTLSVALGRLGHDVCVIAPAYRSALRGEFPLEKAPIKLSVPIGDRLGEATVLKSAMGKGVAVYLVRADAYFDREALYGTADGDYPDNAERFTFFSRAALEMLRHEPPDVVHGHDWQTALAIVFLKVQSDRYPELAASKTVLTIHNLGFQGIFPSRDWPLLGLDPSFFTPPFLEFFGQINFLKGALIFADKITTVSPSYAREIMTSEQGFGLEGVLRQRAADLVGILNGIDDQRWNPWTDPLIARRYGANSLSGKAHCKRSLQLTFGLPDRQGSALIAMISRLTAQKGFDLVQAIFDRLMERNVQFVLLGTGERRYEEFFRAQAARYPDRVGARIGFDEVLAHQIEAGADLLLMPSLYEPCGLNQMFSLRYGTLPIVRAVGGLKDSVEPYDAGAGTGTGFVFEPYDPQALLDTIDRALSVFRNERAWKALCRRAMSMDFSCEKSAKQYLDLYAQLVYQGAR